MFHLQTWGGSLRFILVDLRLQAWLVQGTLPESLMFGSDHACVPLVADVCLWPVFSKAISKSNTDVPAWITGDLPYLTILQSQFCGPSAPRYRSPCQCTASQSLPPAASSSQRKGRRETRSHIDWSSGIALLKLVYSASVIGAYPPSTYRQLTWWTLVWNIHCIRLRWGPNPSDHLCSWGFIGSSMFLVDQNWEQLL